MWALSTFFELKTPAALTAWAVPRKPYHHGDLREALLAEAGKILRESGAADITVREAARRAGVSHNAPYRHFPDRESLLAALAHEAFVEFARVLEAAANRKSPESARKNLGEAYAKFALEHPERYNLMFGDSIPESHYAEIEPIARNSFETLKHVMARNHPGLPDAVLEDLAAKHWAQVHGLVTLMLKGQLHFLKQEKSPEKLIARILDRNADSAP